MEKCLVLCHDADASINVLDVCRFSKIRTALKRGQHIQLKSATWSFNRPLKCLEQSPCWHVFDAQYGAQLAPDQAQKHSMTADVKFPGYRPVGALADIERI